MKYCLKMSLCLTGESKDPWILSCLCAVLVLRACKITSFEPWLERFRSSARPASLAQRENKKLSGTSQGGRGQRQRVSTSGHFRQLWKGGCSVPPGQNPSTDTSNEAELAGQEPWGKGKEEWIKKEQKNKKRGWKQVHSQKGQVLHHYLEFML